MTELYYPEGFFVTTLAADLTVSSTSISLTAVPSRVSKGYAVLEPTHVSKREVVHFTSVGATTITTSDDPTDGSDATGRGCLGSITQGANTAHTQGVTVIISAVEKYWKRLYDGVATILDPTTGDIDPGELRDALYAADAGSNDTYVITLDPVPTLAKLVGLPISFKANTANTGAATLNVNSLGAGTIKKSHDQDLADNDIESGQIVTVVWDGTVFQMQSQVANTTDPTSITVTAAPSADVTATGLKISLVAGQNSAFGDVCYIASNGKATLVDADAIASGYGLVMALATISADATGSFLLLGVARNDAWNWTVGGPVFITVTGTTGNTLSQTGVSGTDDVHQIVGIATHADRIFFNPQLMLIEWT